jgi:hypothetical protein
MKMQPKTEHSESEYIVIPNPVYDVVFRYLMEDPESAAIVVSTLINEKIKTIQLEAMAHTEKREADEDGKDADIRFFQLDFTATIEKSDGSEELIMIEMQKAAAPSDIFRFKRYISKQFQKKVSKEVISPKTQSVETVQMPIRLIPIFILNFRIENEINDPFIRIKRSKVGIFKNKELQKHNEFIDHLSYDMCVIQLPNLSNVTEDDYADDENKQKLFALLKLFDQKSKVKGNEHRLRLIRKFFPGFLDRVIKRLQAAASENPNLEEEMFIEDEYFRVIEQQDNTISFLRTTVAEKDKLLEKNRQKLEEKQKVIEENQQKLEEKQNTLLNAARALKKTGLPIADIQQITGLSEAEIAHL